MQNEIGLGASHKNQWKVSDRTVDLSRPQIEKRRISFKADPQSVTIDLNRTAMVVVDMQNSFCHSNGWCGKLGLDITETRKPIGSLKKFLPTLRDVNVPIIWLNWGNRSDRMNLSPGILHAFNPTGRGIGIGDEFSPATGPVLQKDSWDSQVVEELEADTEDIWVDKFRISGFWDSPLDSILRNLGVQTLLFGGVNLDQCVMATLQDASFLGYDCILVDDCAATNSPRFCVEAAHHNLKLCYGFLARSEEITHSLK